MMTSLPSFCVCLPYGFEIFIVPTGCYGIVRSRALGCKCLPVWNKPVLLLDDVTCQAHAPLCYESGSLQQFRLELCEELQKVCVEPMQRRLIIFDWFPGKADQTRCTHLQVTSCDLTWLSTCMQSFDPSLPHLLFLLSSFSVAGTAAADWRRRRSFQT